MPYLLVHAAAETWISLTVVTAVAVGIVLLLRNRERCPKDRSSMRLVSPAKGKHMVFRCGKCGYERKTRVPIGRR